MVKLLVKANDEVLSHCRCEGAPLASVPSQMDCPWCGCGWLICCGDCGKAFTYGRVVEADTDYASFIRSDFSRRGYTTIDDEDVRLCVIAMEQVMAPFAVGQVVVFLDGWYHALDAGPIRFEGDYAVHDLERLPHRVALDQPDYLIDHLGDVAYWTDRERPDRD